MHSKSIIDYCNKLILAPMVRGSLLPMRLLALRHGADLVYTDEIIDHSMLLTTRKVNNILGTIDYVNEENAFLLFRTCATEKQKLVFQIGTADPTRAIQVAKMVENDVSAIDINMGCPKPYSTSMGIGAALLSNVDGAKGIVRGLVENIKLPITCKIRISDDIDTTINMVKDFEALGVSAIAVHGRTRYQTSSEPVNKLNQSAQRNVENVIFASDAIRKISESVQIPIIANGGSRDMTDLSDVMKFKEDCGATSVMVARAALVNASIFRKEGKIPVHDLIDEYLKLCIEYDHPCNNVKYALRPMLKPLGKIAKSPIGKNFEAATSLEEICDIWNLGDYCREKQSEYKAKGWHATLGIKPPTGNYIPIEIIRSREQKFSEKNIIAERMGYKRDLFDIAKVPKVVLHAHCGRNKMLHPTYESERKDRQFSGIVTVAGKRYSSVFWHKTAQYAEQAAALVCCLHLGLYEEDFLVSIGCLHKS